MKMYLITILEIDFFSFEEVQNVFEDGSNET